MSSRTKIYTGIGSRLTPPAELVRIESIAALLHIGRWKLRSGGADGADRAFQKGADPYMEIYLPWENFNGWGWGNEAPFYCFPRMPKKSQAMLIAEDVHPAWHYCDAAARKLHARNVMQVLGADLDQPSSFVICWTLDGRTKGGTRTALVLAERNNVPIINLADPLWAASTAEEIVTEALRLDYHNNPAT